MWSVGAIALANPWMLAALVTLPALWWLLKVTPPAPRRVIFPAVRLLLGLTTPEQASARTPPWLLALRLMLAGLVIVALAHPLLNPGARLDGTGPVLIVVDDGWAAASGWQARAEVLEDLITQTERAGRPVALLTTAPPASGEPIRPSQLLPAATARDLALSLQPKPWRTDRAAAAAALDHVKLDESTQVVWLADGLDDGAATLTERLRRFASVQVIADPPESMPVVLRPPGVEGPRLRVRASRAGAGPMHTVWVRASSEQGALLARTKLTFADRAREAEGVVELPVEVRNKLARLEVEGERSAAAVVLADERWRRRVVGLVSGSGVESAQPLLYGLFFLERALEPFSEVRFGTIGELLRRRLAVLILADVGQVIGDDRVALDEWLRQGGVLVRFAGPKLAEKVDDLIPVRLRTGGRSLGGALSWDQPARLAPFPETSPFHGLDIPGDIRVRRQVLAEPSLELGAKTWARINDGTPLVTAAARERGRLILFHVTANTDWSNLPLSGLFVDMLRRIVGISQGVGGADAKAALPAFATLDAYGKLGEPPASARPIATADLAAVTAAPDHPPGYYGTAEARRALNLSASIGDIRALESLPDGFSVTGYAPAEETDLKPWLLVAAIVLGLVDIIASYWLRGLFARGFRPAAATVAAVCAAAWALTLALPALAQSSAEEFALTATLETHLAYVKTGIPKLDQLSQAGLVGLSGVLARRTSVELGSPIGVDLEADEIAFFPLLYWPVDPAQKDLSRAALAKIDTYMKNGGTILFDTRDRGAVAPGIGFGGSASSAMRRLREVLRHLNIPPLIPVPSDHVLTRAFYLIGVYPGRWAGGKVWVERHPGGTNDGVSSIIIGGNDWASAWAVDDENRPLAAVVPGGERQRELAFRFGVNLVMYTLTGNYKADQVHVPAILERLGQ